MPTRRLRIAEHKPHRIYALPSQSGDDLRQIQSDAQDRDAVDGEPLARRLVVENANHLVAPGAVGLGGPDE